MNERNCKVLKDSRTKKATVTAIKPDNCDKVLSALLSEPTIKAAATRARVSEVTIWRYLKEPDFAAKYRKLRREVVEHTLLRMQGDISGAVGVLQAIATDTEQPASARVAAAKAIIERTLHVVELGDMAARLAELETRVQAQQEEKARAARRA